ncbi:DegT/DnrJ/EryC1/StrS family aminotransferase [Bacillus halotolerans]|uniref:DegT/DnrJ/EryC1/StrS family aminotransferase n=1 Tax=Bacillus halotolerans TaxID=260554 RepID=A0A9Q6AAQ9_9BACI|nr:DegT/DnrJ/EryC1/StrS family aminotransferase [Bacillus sp. 7705b]MEC1603412.1 DegT/DnrJ/EryC1/StrS family aminotransferase [Bacillus halotolerans]PAY14426.1 DegT/DnrJ/EryC1/StrS family aminotransferase [Bacillus sp. 7705b]PLS09121.1 DegT/DnrJ/EryC1/StrS family aminotransferase [Bacillus halotolerans]
MTNEELETVAETIKSGWISKGPKVIEFEKKLGEYLGAEHVISCNSGTAALHMALLALGVGEGDEVIVPSFTFCSSVNVILHVGATPVFADICEDDLCIDPEDVRQKLSPRTKAVIAVHFAGHPANLDELSSICKENGLYLIEDAAHALGTRYNGKMIGTHGDAVCFSFYATKNITTGEGGALILKDEEAAERARLYGWHGITKNAWNRYGEKGSWRYDVLLPGFKYNMTDIQAALGLIQLKRAAEIQEKRTRIAKYYASELTNQSERAELPLTDIPSHITHSWHLFILRVKKRGEMERDQFIENMKAKNIGLSVHFIPVHMHPYYSEHFPAKLPVTERIFPEIVSLPLYSQLSKEDCQYIVQSIKDVLSLSQEVGQ